MVQFTKLIQILDAHIHLWPQTVGGYNQVTAGPQSLQYSLAGYIFIETGQRASYGSNVESWASGSLAEIAWLRRLVEGTPKIGDSFTASDSNLIKGIVPWVPIDRGVADFQNYMQAAKKTAGDVTWSKIRGWRFLLQGIWNQQQFKKITKSNETEEILRRFAGQWAFDIGIDSHFSGTWQLESVTDMIEKVSQGSKKTNFVVNHLSNPDLGPQNTAQQKESFEKWKAAVVRLSRHRNVYMKISGGFSGITDLSPTSPWAANKLAERIQPHFDHIVKTFTPERMLWGSDWPVVNMKGPADGSGWSLWRDVVVILMMNAKLDEEAIQRIFFGTAVEAYQLNVTTS